MTSSGARLAELSAGADASASEATSALRSVREMVREARSLRHAASTRVVLETAADIACRCLGYVAYVVAVQANGYYHFTPAPQEADRVPRTEDAVMTPSTYRSLCAAATEVEGTFWLAPGQLRLLEVANRLERSRPLPARLGPLGKQAVVWAPVTGETGDNAGVIFLQRPAGVRQPLGPLEAGQLGLLAELASLALALGSLGQPQRQAELVAEAQRRQLEDLIAASLEVRREPALEGVLASIARAMASAVGFDRAAVWLLEERDGRPPVKLGEGIEPGQDAGLKDVPVVLAATVGLSTSDAAHLASAWASLGQFAPLLRPEMRLSRSYLLDHRYFAEPDDLSEMVLPGPVNEQWAEGTWHPDDSLTVPLEDREGNLLGLISMDEPLNRAVPTRDDCRALEFFADQCALAVVESRRLQRAQREATSDPLTGLANRRGLLEEGSQVVLRSQQLGTACSALYVDIDHFKAINDTFGHSKGDQVLAVVGRTIASRLRRGDLVARYGGEEFVALLPDAGLEQATMLAEEIRGLVERATASELGAQLCTRVSVGVATLRSGEDMHSLLARADVALYDAKRSGRNRVCIASG